LRRRSCIRPKRKAVFGRRRKSEREPERRAGGRGGAEGKTGRGAEGQRSRGAEEKRRVDVMEKLVKTHRDLEVYRLAFDVAMKVFEVSKTFPKEEKYSLTDQIRRSSRSVCSNVAEAWRKRRYEAAFVLKLNDSEAEAAETQTWIEFAVACGYLDKKTARDLYRAYNSILGKLVTMISRPVPWLMPRKQVSRQSGRR
jgi:four helix bundle protein